MRSSCRGERGPLPLAARRPRRRDLHGAPALPAGGAVLGRGERRPRRPSRRGSPRRPAHRGHRAARRGAERALRARGQSEGEDLAALDRRAAARRDPEGALPGRAHPDHGRADRGAHTTGGREALRDAPHDGRRGEDRHLHLAQAPRGEGDRRPRDRASRWPDGCDRRRRAVDSAVARDPHGRTRDRRCETARAGQAARGRPHARSGWANGSG